MTPICLLMRLWFFMGLIYVGLVGAVSTNPSQHNKLLRVTKRQASSNSSNDVLDALKKANLTKVANLLESNPSVLRQAYSSPGFKTFLAPTDSALPFLNWVNVTEALLYHILNGSVPIDQLARLPDHTVLHSILDSDKVVNLPGGNGQAVALSTGTTTYPNYQDYTPQVNEALNSDYFIVQKGGQVQTISVGQMTILPINRVLTVPGNVTFTANVIAKSPQFANLLASLPNGIDDITGLTVFLPTAEAYSKFTSEHKGLSQATLQAVLQNHIIAKRAVYSPLLIDQGSMVTASGQDLHVNQINQTSGDTYSLQVNVGNATANITQTDIMHKTGVIHLIDTVLFDTSFDEQRANQAALSAQKSATSNISGPISSQNSASNQGTDVPASPPGSNSPLNSNSTITTDSENGSTRNGMNSTSNSMTSSHKDSALHSLSTSFNLMVFILFLTIFTSMTL